MPPKAPIPTIRARPARAAQSLGTNDQPGANLAGAVIGQQGSQVARPLPTQDTTDKPSGTIQGGGPTTHTSTLTPTEPKGKGRMTPSITGGSDAARSHQRGSRTSQASGNNGRT